MSPSSVPSKQQTASSATRSSSSAFAGSLLCRPEGPSMTRGSRTRSLSNHRVLCVVAWLAFMCRSEAFAGSSQTSFLGRRFRGGSSSAPRQQQNQQDLTCIMQVPRVDSASSESGGESNKANKYTQKLNGESASVRSIKAYRNGRRLDRKGMASDSRIEVEFVADTKLPTDLGHFRLRAYRIPGAPAGQNEPMVIYARDRPPFQSTEAVPVRVHDQCLTSEVFRSQRCDCKEQLTMALKYIQENGGCVIYLQQEGRGIGLANKVAAYALQDHGLDTVDANLHLGFPEDSREYGVIPSILEDLNIPSISLMTNNPRKVERLEVLGVSVENTLPMVVPATNKYNRKYMETKKSRMRHNNLGTVLSRESTELPPTANAAMAPRRYVSRQYAESAADATNGVQVSLIVEDEEEEEAGVKASENGYCFGRESVEKAIAAMARGEMVVVVDDMDRENEGDFIMAADKCTDLDMAQIVRYSSGVVCIAMEDDRMKELKLPPMVTNNEDPKGTAFSVTVDATKEHGISTGISAKDRAKTVRMLADPSTTSLDFNRPGHIFPLRAQEGGVLARDGHTEASVDLARLAGCNPAGVLCEIVSEENPTEMMRLPELKRFCKQHGYVMTSIVDLAQFRRDTGQ